MLDIRLVRDNTDMVIDALKKRSEDTSVLDKFLSIESRRRDLLRAVEDDRQQRNILSQEIGKIKKQTGTKFYDPEREKEVLERLRFRLRLRSREKQPLKERDVKNHASRFNRWKAYRNLFDGPKTEEI